MGLEVFTRVTWDLFVVYGIHVNLFGHVVRCVGQVSRRRFGVPFGQFLRGLRLLRRFVNSKFYSLTVVFIFGRLFVFVVRRNFVLLSHAGRLTYALRRRLQ